MISGGSILVDEKNTDMYLFRTFCWLRNLWLEFTHLSFLTVILYVQLFFFGFHILIIVIFPFSFW